MANDARTQFIDGLRVTAEHLQHLQDRLREAVRDVRHTIGLRKVAWGLRVTSGDGSVTITPGVAFAAERHPFEHRYRRKPAAAGRSGPMARDAEGRRSRIGPRCASGTSRR